MKKYVKKSKQIVIILIYITIIAIGSYFNINKENQTGNVIENNISYNISNIPAYSGEIYIEINNNIPEFTEEDLNIEEYYSTLENGRVRNSNYKNMLGKSK